MTAESDPLVRVEAVALALGVSMNYARLKAKQGELPPLSAQIETRTKSIRAWPLSVLIAHNQELGKRCALLVAVTDLMKPLPPKAA